MTETRTRIKPHQITRPSFEKPQKYRKWVWFLTGSILILALLLFIYESVTSGGGRGAAVAPRTLELWQIVLLAVAIFAAASYLPKTWTGMARAATVVGTALIVVLGWPWSTDPVVRSIVQWNRLPPPSATAPAPSPQVAKPRCSGEKFPVTLDTTPRQINPHGQCAFDFWVTSGCVFLQRASWVGDTKAYGPFCGGKVYGNVPNDVEWIWSANGTITIAVSLPPPRYR